MVVPVTLGAARDCIAGDGPAIADIRVQAQNVRMATPKLKDELQEAQLELIRMDLILTRELERLETNSKEAPEVVRPAKRPSP